MKKIILAFLLLLSTNAFSQEKQESSGVTDIFKVTFLNPGISYEKKLAKFQTLYLQAFMNLAVSTSTDVFGRNNDAKFYLDPALTLQYRYYYNFKHRSDKGRRTSFNNLNYVSAVWQTFFSKVPLKSTYYQPENRRPVHIAAVVWGIQRNNRKRFSLDLNVGPGVLFSKTNYNDFSGNKFSISQSQFTLYSQLNLGFWLNKRAKDWD